MKFSTTIGSRSRSTGSSSPKRIQNPTSGHLGEKSSPKKVKLGLHTPASAKSRSFPSVFHPSNIPLSSTPKLVNKTNPFKGNLNQAWLHHNTPIKGLLKAGQLRKKKNEDPTLETGKVLPPREIASELFSERSQRNNLIHNEQSIKGQRVQAVQPVQKQIISREELSFGEKRSDFTGGGAESNIIPLSRQSCEPCTTLPYQKEREQHLRFYHQQFQQPPILQQKLNYQPLEKFLAQYRPQEVNLQHNSNLKDSASPQHEDGTHFEELDDSDFSEDSFSFLSNQKRRERQEIQNGSNQHSFFLHQLEPSTEVEQKAKNEHSLVFKYESQAQEPVYTADSTFPRMKEPVHEDVCSKNQSNCNIKNDSPAYDSCQSNSTAEKTYSPPEDFAYNGKNILNTPAEHKYNLKDKWQGHANINPSQETHSLSMSNILDPGVVKPNEKTIMSCGSVDESAEVCWTSAERSEPKENVRTDAGNQAPLNASSDSGFGLMAPLSMSLLHSEKFAGFENVSLNQIQKPVTLVELLDNMRASCSENTWASESQENIITTADNISKLVEQILRYDRASKLQHIPHAENVHFPLQYDESRSLSSPLCLLPSSTHQGSVSEESAQDTEAPLPKFIETYRNNDNSMFFRTDLQQSNLSSRQYDADTEDTTGGICLLSSPEKCPSYINKEMKPTKELDVTTHLIAGDNGSASFSNACSSLAPSLVLQSTGNVQWKTYLKENNELELKSDTSNPALNDSEDSFTLPFYGEEMGILKHKLMSSILKHTNLIPMEPDSGSLDNEIDYSSIQDTPKILAPTNSQTSISEVPIWRQGTLEKVQQLVIQAHREQLNEITTLSMKEESLLSQISQSDFKEYVTKLDEIMVLKSKCIQSMRAQLQLYLAYPKSAAERTRNS